MEYFFNFEKLAYLKGERPPGCILCLVRDKDPRVVNMMVYHDEYMGISLNLYPYNPGHLLIFPLRHVGDIRELGDEERTAMDRTLDRALSVMDSLYSPAAYNIGFNMGRAAGASIDHLHLHIIPRYPTEIGIAELLAGKRVLVEDITLTRQRLSDAFRES
ncbi:MAG: HIT domain-containing protein [Spirochaetaceae bacterium]|nr:HIT domain-containing protein [Spirochaetaceae bacterium]